MSVSGFQEGDSKADSLGFGQDLAVQVFYHARHLNLATILLVNLGPDDDELESEINGDCNAQNAYDVPGPHA